VNKKMKNSSEYIYIDARGDWWYEGNRIIHPEVLKLFKSSLQADPENGQLKISYKGREAPVKVEKTPFFVQDIAVDRSPEGELERIELLLDDESREELDPATLTLDADGILQVRVKDGAFAALCLPTAHFRLAELFSEDGAGGFTLELAGRSWPVAHR
jgi:hypothetical protein